MRNRMDTLEGLVLEITPPELRRTMTANANQFLSPDPPKTLPPPNPNGKAQDRPWAAAVVKIFEEFENVKDEMFRLDEFLVPVSIKDKLNPQIPPPDNLGESAIFKDMTEILFRLRVLSSNLHCLRQSLFL